MRFVFYILAILAAINWTGTSCAQADDKILLVLSSHGRDQGRSQTGFEMDEYSQAWAVFRANGFSVDVASPAGGPVEADEFEPDKSYNAATLADPEAMRWLGATLRTSEVVAENYDAIYVLGGGGAMFDLYADPALRRLLAASYEAGRVIGGVCHGPAVLAQVRLSNGRPVVEGRRVTGFTNAEEALFGNRWASSYPVLLETAMIASGAQFVQAPAMLPFVAADERIVTGQNPFSTALAVEEMIRAIGREPIARELYVDERSLLLVARFLRGEQQAAAAELAAGPEIHDPALIGIYGNILVQQAEDDPSKLGVAIALMQLANDHAGWNPRLELAIARAEHQLGRSREARDRATAVLSRNPDSEAAKTLLASIGD